MEYIDTDDIRRRNGLPGDWDWETVSELCDALDAERDRNLRMYHGRTYAEYLKSRVDRAEARIAAALKLCDESGYSPETETVLAAVRSSLT